ncbi:MAG TPA: elongation factor G [Phycisphaerae bacterium]|nr:elongation factor G [Phycisphaerae bacterium]
MSIDLRKVRNIGIAAHIDAGKTTTTEAMLFFSGRTHKIGMVDNGTTITDFDHEEQQRGITIYSAAVSLPWHDHTLNLIDTPGHVDFTAEVERALRVLDGAVAVFDAKEGVEAQSETVWHQADKYRVPRICFINKMDKVGADFASTFASIRDRLVASPVAVQIPIGAENLFEGLIDLLEMKAYYYQPEDQGAKFEVRPVPPELEEPAKRARHRLEEQVAETCDALMEKFVHDQPLTADEIRKALRAAAIANRLQPVFCGSALHHIGVRKLMDGVVDYLPCPLDLPPAVGIKPQPAVGKHKGRSAFAGPGTVEKEEKTECPCDPKAPLVAYVFKIVADKPMDLYFLRVYSGTLRANSRVYNPARDCKENISRLFRVFAKRREQIDYAEAGDIVAALGLKEALTGDTLCDQRHPMLLEKIEFPETVISMSVEPESSADRDKLLDALTMLGRENPTFQFRVNEETGQMLISGMGELHLEVLINRLKRDLNVRVRVGKPRVSYRETVRSAGEAEEEFSRQIGGRGHYARVRLRVEPFTPGPGQDHVVFASEVSYSSLKREFLDSAEQGIRETATTGVLAGNPMMNIKVTLLSAVQHEVDSSEVAFDTAGRRCFDKAAAAASPALMEPIMKLQIVTPELYFGVVSADLARRRGVVSDSRLRGEQRVIDALVPLREMFGYATELRSLTQGRGGWTMEPSHYAVVPHELASAILSLV